MRLSSWVVVIVVLAMAVANAFAQGKGANPNGKPFVEIQGQIVEVEGEISSLQDQIDALVGRVDTMEQRVDANEAAIDSLQTQNASLQDQINLNAGDITALETEIAILQGENQDLQAQIDANSGDIAAAQQQIDTNSGLIVALQQSMSELGTDLQDQIDNNYQLIVALIAETNAIKAALAFKQTIVSGNCPPGSSIRQVNPDGSVVCEPDDSGLNGFLTRDVLSCSSGIAPGGFVSRDVSCPAGFTMTGGGHHTHRFWIEDSRPSFLGSNTWRVRGQNASSFSNHLCSYVRCIAPAP